MKQKILLTTSLLICSAQTAVFAIDLFDTYKHALVFNANYLKAQANNLAGQESANIARSMLLPQANATLSLTENYLNSTGIYAFYNQPVYSVQLTQVLIDFGKFSAYTKGKFAAELSSLQEQISKQQLMVDVSQTYFNVLYAEDTLLATKMTKNALKQQLTQAQAAFSSGVVTIADVNDALAAYDAAVAQEIQDQNNVIYQKNIFRNLTGVNPDLIQPLEHEISLNLPTPNSNESWSNIARAHNLSIKISNKQVAMAKQDISIARAGHFPVINLVAQYQYQDTGNIDQTNATAAQLAPIASIPGSPLSSYGTGSLGLQVSVPLSTGGRVSALTRQAASVFESSTQQLIAVERQIDQQVKNAYWNVENGVSLVNAQKAAMKSFKTKLDSDKLGYEVGVRNSVDLVGAQKDYFKSFQQYQQSRYQFLMSQVQLYYLGGTINEKTLRDINANIKH